MLNENIFFVIFHFLFYKYMNLYLLITYILILLSHLILNFNENFLFFYCREDLLYLYEIK